MPGLSHVTTCTIANAADRELTVRHSCSVSPLALRIRSRRSSRRRALASSARPPARVCRARRPLVRRSVA